MLSVATNLIAQPAIHNQNASRFQGAVCIRLEIWRWQKFIEHHLPDFFLGSL